VFKFDRKKASLTTTCDPSSTPFVVYGAGEPVSIIPADDTPPVFQYSGINASGTSISFTFDAPVMGHTGFSVVATSGTLLTYASGDPSSTIFFSTSRAFASGETVHLYYDPGTVTDLAGNMLAPITNGSVSNGSVR
jgi:hypothetical protein